jgi:hypothetical protein
MCPAERNARKFPMILPVVRERFEALLRQPALEGVVSALQSGAKAAGCVGLTELAKRRGCLRHSQLRRHVPGG